MSNYEINIERVDNSTFAIGKKAKAEGRSGDRYRDDMAETLRVLIGIISDYTDPAADEVRGLALDASREISADKPKKEVFRRLADAARDMMDKLGSRLIEAGALADAVAKISGLIQHL